MSHPILRLPDKMASTTFQQELDALFEELHRTHTIAYLQRTSCDNSDCSVSWYYLCSGRGNPHGLRYRVNTAWRGSFYPSAYASIEFADFIMDPEAICLEVCQTSSSMVLVVWLPAQVEV